MWTPDGSAPLDGRRLPVWMATSVPVVAARESALSLLDRNPFQEGMAGSGLDGPATVGSEPTACLVWDVDSRSISAA
jgi:hypothetical protein